MMKKIDEGSLVPAWENVPEDITPYVGFVYIIEHIATGKKYIGKKIFGNINRRKFTRKPNSIEKKRLEQYKYRGYNSKLKTRAAQVKEKAKFKGKYKQYKSDLYQKYKGDKKTIIVRTESNWKSYWGSCETTLPDDLEEYGYNAFKRTIIRLCFKAWECSYYEAKLQFDYGVLLSDDYYNGAIRIKLKKHRCMIR